MFDLDDLYQETILDHNRHPRNFGKLEGCDFSAEGRNPLCGDQLVIYVKVEDDVVEDIRFEGSGCAISKASASLMTESLKGKTRDEVADVFQRFRNLVMGVDVDTPSEELGKLVAFHGLSEFPVRVKCATLAWHTLQAALQNESEPVTTE
jgi:nitrogen fixation NifU-like protein